MTKTYIIGGIAGATVLGLIAYQATLGKKHESAPATPVATKPAPVVSDSRIISDVKTGTFTSRTYDIRESTVDLHGKPYVAYSNWEPLEGEESVMFRSKGDVDVFYSFRDNFSLSATGFYVPTVLKDKAGSVMHNLPIGSGSFNLETVVVGGKTFAHVPMSGKTGADLRDVYFVPLDGSGLSGVNHSSSGENVLRSNKGIEGFIYVPADEYYARTAQREFLAKKEAEATDKALRVKAEAEEEARKAALPKPTAATSQPFN